jgi:hypothetical protein
MGMDGMGGDGVDMLLDAMVEVQTVFVAGLGALPFLSQGITEKTKDAALEWYALVRLAPTDGAQNKALMGRTMAHTMSLSAHQKMAVARLEADVGRALELCVGIMRTRIAVLGSNPGPLQLVVGFDARGTLSKPLWRVAHHGLHGLSPVGPTRSILAGLLKDLALEPMPTGIYKIGNKTYAAASPESALSQHIRLLAPKTPKHKRKAPTTIPSVLRVWDRGEAQAMAKAITLSWSQKT